MATLRAVRLIMGLGNPGVKYRNTYHNAGLLAVTYFATHLVRGGEPHRARFFTYTTHGELIFAHAYTFMNESGRAVAKAVQLFNVQPEELLLVHDDADLSLGAFKFSFNRGAGGHRGVESVIATLGTKAFWRLRIGISPGAWQKKEGTAPEQRRAGDFVLTSLRSADRRVLNLVFERSAKDLRRFVRLDSWGARE